MIDGNLALATVVFKTLEPIFDGSIFCGATPLATSTFAELATKSMGLLFS